MTSKSWDLEVDIIAVGFGAAGAAVAIAGADAGAEVLVIEKQPKEWHHPNTRLGGGLVMAVSDVESAVRYLDLCAAGLTPVDCTRAWAEQASEVLDWVERATQLEQVRVLDAHEHARFEGAHAVGGYGPRLALEGDPEWSKRGGRMLFAAFERAVHSLAGAAVIYDAPARRLVRNGSGCVVGVECNASGNLRRYGARRAVVLTCGGYEYDEALKGAYLRTSPTYFYGSPANTGDGIRMAQALGADLWHMSVMVGHSVGHFEEVGFAYTLAVRPTLAGGYVFLDRRGRRFVNELNHRRHDFHYHLAEFDAEAAEYPRIPSYYFFDSRRLSGRSVFLDGSVPDTGPHAFTVSDRCRDEIRRGWIATADHLEALVEVSGVEDAGRALRSLTEYNTSCRTGVDPFGRPAETLIPLDQPPFFSMPLWPGGANTAGGPRRNRHGQVIDVFGEPIPGLYEAGELGEVLGSVYPCGGASISDAICFGQIAVEHALR